MGFLRETNEEKEQDEIIGGIYRLHNLSTPLAAGGVLSGSLPRHDCLAVVQELGSVRVFRENRSVTLAQRETDSGAAVLERDSSLRHDRGITGERVRSDGYSVWPEALDAHRGTADSYTWMH